MEHHGRGLRRLLKQDSQQSDSEIDTILEKLKTDPLNSPLAAADIALLKYAIVLTRSPGDVSEAHIESLRDHGFDDRAIHDLACCVGYFAFVNRIADGLGVQLEN